MEPRADWTIEQEWDRYSAEEHARWRTLYQRQMHILQDRVTPEFLQCVKTIGVMAEGVPDFRRVNEVLAKTTGWQVVAVPGLIPDEIFFEHLANRRFVSTCFIRGADQMDYLEEPDIFHDTFGHVPLLAHPVFADYLQAYGMGGVKALHLGHLKNLARLYWYTVEFGLIRTPEGLRIYGAGIVSSKGESVYCLEDPRPKRIAFDLRRILRTNYKIDDYQAAYFVIDSFEQLFQETAPDFTAIYEDVNRLEDIAPGVVVPSDRLIDRDDRLAA